MDNIKYLVIEIQQNADGTVGNIITTKDTQNEAESVFYQILASAAISKLTIHSAVIIMSNGNVLKSIGYDRRSNMTEE